MSKKQITPFKPYESRNPSGNEKGYVRLTKSLYLSDAMRDLKDLSVRVLLDIKFTANGNDEVIYTQKMAKDSLNLSKGGYTSAINQLIEIGFIERMPRGCYAPARYKFSKKWQNHYSHRRDMFTGEYIYK